MKQVQKKLVSILTGALCGVLLALVSFSSVLKPVYELISPVNSTFANSMKKEVFGFAPYWNISQLDNIDFNILTTLAYFGVPVKSDGNLDVEDPGYITFKSDEATRLFQKAHSYGTRVVLTLTQMENDIIEAFINDPRAQARTIDQTVEVVKKRGLDGVNVDFEYIGNPGQEYRDKFSKFVANLSRRMHDEVKGSQITVSVYASAVKEPKIYDIADLARDSDGIFMMAYDFATTASDSAIPTSPLHGHKEGKYWYDISTAVDDFLTQMPANKLILGVPWYGYNYLVYSPGVKAETRPYYSWRGEPIAQTYSSVAENIKPEMEGWDNHGKVGWKAYYVQETGTWRMIFSEDKRSLGIKYDFAKNKNLAGVGIWALGFDEGRKELWTQLQEKFGIKVAKDKRIKSKTITDI